MAKHIDADLTHKTFQYNLCTGLLTLKNSRGMGGMYKKGSSVGTIHKCGHNKGKTYLRTYFNESYIYTHRIIWVMMTGEQPEDIDHIDGNGINNKWDNLRNVSHSMNGKNQKIHTTNTSGTSGVTYRKDSDRWRARIMVDDKMISLGTFKDKSEAINTRKEAEKMYGYI